MSQEVFTMLRAMEFVAITMKAKELQLELEKDLGK